MKSFFFATLLFVPVISSAKTVYRLDLEDNRFPQRNFVIEISSITNPSGFSSLKTFIGHGVKLDENANPIIGIAAGRIEKTAPTSEHNWNFKFISDTVEFAENTIEVCDGNFKYVEDNFDTWMQETNGQYCPWNTAGLVQRISKNGAVLWQRLHVAARRN